MADNKQDKKTFLLRLSPVLWNELERMAGDEFRSINGEIEYLLSKAIQERKGKKIKVG